MLYSVFGVILQREKDLCPKRTGKYYFHVMFLPRYSLVHFSLILNLEVDVMNIGYTRELFSDNIKSKYRLTFEVNLHGYILGDYVGQPYVMTELSKFSDGGLQYQYSLLKY